MSCTLEYNRTGGGWPPGTVTRVRLDSMATKLSRVLLFQRQVKPNFEAENMRRLTVCVDRRHMYIQNYAMTMRARAGHPNAEPRPKSKAARKAGLYAGLK